MSINPEKLHSVRYETASSSKKKIYDIYDNGMPYAVEDLELSEYKKCTEELKLPKGLRVPRGVLIPEGLMVPESFLPPNNITSSKIDSYIHFLRNNVGIHHYFWPKPYYEQEILYKTLRNLEMAQIALPNCVHREININYYPPEQPNPDQALSIILHAFKKHETLNLMTGTAFRSTRKPISHDIIDEIIINYKDIEKGEHDDALSYNENLEYNVGT